MNVLGVILLTAPLFGFAMFGAWLAGYIHRAASVPPRNGLLTVVAYLLDGVTVGVTAAVVLGFASILFNAAGVRILPFPLPTVLIYVAVIAPSVGAIPLYRYIKRSESAE